METTANLTSPEVLLGILATLQRLEVHFQQQDGRLSTIESSIRSDSIRYEASSAGDSWRSRHKAGTETPRSSLDESSWSQVPASLYRISVQRLRKHFELLIDSRPDLLSANVKGKAIQTLSMNDAESTYSRSRISLLHTGPYGKGVDHVSSPINNPPLSASAMNIVAIRYEDTESLPDMAAPSEGRNSSSTSRTSATRRPSREWIEQAVTPAQNVTGSIKRSVSLRSNGRTPSLKSAFSLRSSNNKSVEMEAEQTVGQKQQSVPLLKQMRSWMGIVPRLLKKAGRAIMDAQFRMLDVAV